MELQQLRHLYLESLKQRLTRSFGESYQAIDFKKRTVRRALYRPIKGMLNSVDLELVRKKDFDYRKREEGRDWPLEAETMIGHKRLQNLQDCVTTVLDQRIPGDLIETGVWRGGATIFMRAILQIYGDTERKVWVADSFEGLPKPDVKTYPQDEGDKHWRRPQLAVSLDEVKKNFEKYGLLDDQVVFLKGWFQDTLPSANIEKIAVLRLDGDMYGSTIVALDSLYPKVSSGGFVIVDDYHIPTCKQAVTDYRAQHGIDEPIETIDWTGVYWRKK